MNDYATKPISKKKLLALVDHWCHNKPSASSTPISSNDRSTKGVLLDDAVLRTLAEDAGMSDVSPLLRIFITELETRHTAIIQAIENQDLNALGHESHALKSSAATFGATSLHALAVEIDGCCKKGNLSDALRQAKILIPCAEATLAALHQRCSE